MCWLAEIIWGIVHANVFQAVNCWLQPIHACCCQYVLVVIYCLCRVSGCLNHEVSGLLFHQLVPQCLLGLIQSPPRSLGKKKIKTLILSGLGSAQGGWGILGALGAHTGSLGKCHPNSWLPLSRKEKISLQWSLKETSQLLGVGKAMLWIYPTQEQT